MPIKIIWRSTVFLATLILIYLAFPILIVPSALPAIQQMFIANEFPSQYPADIGSFTPQGETTDLEILELSIPKTPTFQDKINLLKTLHRQGMDKILQRDTTQTDTN